MADIWLSKKTYDDDEVLILFSHCTFGNSVCLKLMPERINCWCDAIKVRPVLYARTSTKLLKIEEQKAQAKLSPAPFVAGISSSFMCNLVGFFIFTVQI